MDNTKIDYITLRKEFSTFNKIKITSSKISADYIRQFYHDDLLIYESFFLLLLDNSLNTIGYAKISQGGIVGTVVDVRIVCKYAIDALATHVIFAHNHPSGRVMASDADISITKKMKDALKMFDVQVLDHIILAHDQYLSFADDGIL
jgi:DNA repair protein RadC